MIEKASPNLPSTNERDLLEALAGAAVKWWVGRRPIMWTLEQHFRNPFVNCLTATERILALAIKDWCEYNWRKEQREQSQQKRISQQGARSKTKRAVVGDSGTVDSRKY